MNEAQREWLNKLDEQSRAKQDAFMNDIASKLGRPRVTTKPNHPFRGAPEGQALEWSLEERIERFTANFQASGGYVARFAGLREAVRYIGDKAAETKARLLIRQNQPELAEVDWEQAVPNAKVAAWNSDPSENWKSRAAEADIGIAVAEGAAANTGSVLVQSSPDKGRSVSLLPAKLFLIVPAQRLESRLGGLLARFDALGKADLPAGIHFISGPSRSADIENDLTIGVHGPGIVCALLIG